MIRFTAKTRYGISAVIELAGHYGDGVIGLKRIAERHEIPVKFLDQIMGQLARAGIVRAARGSEGGYQLAQRPEGIPLYRVLEALTGASEPESNPILSDLVRKAEDGLKNIFQVSLGELAAREQGQALTYHI
jgi:Rrf2 family cysteine metabolism transcriptional repressor